MSPVEINHPSRVILGVDGSADSLAGIHLLKNLPCFPHCSLLGISVWSGRSSADRARLEQAGQRARELLSGGCAALEIELRSGHAAENLVRAAVERQADLIVLGARGQRGVLDVLLGGVATQVVEHAPCPVLLAREPAGELRRVLLAVDGSVCSQLAAEYLAGFNLPVECEVVVAAVAPPPGLGGMGMNAWPVGQELVPVLSDRELAELEALREEEKARLRAAQEQAVNCLVESGKRAGMVMLEGDPAGELIKYGRANQVDLMAAGSRGLSAVRGWILGSVSHKLVQYAGRSVMIIRGAACDEPQSGS